MSDHSETAEPPIFSAKAKRTIGLALAEWKSIYVQQRDALPDDADERCDLENDITYIKRLSEWIHNMPTKDVTDG